jgi:MFS family permease
MLRRFHLATDSKRLLIVAAALFANGYATANPFPYSPFLVMHFGITDDERAVGFFAGYFISVFMLGRLFSSYPLGILSDTMGRRPVIELGLLSCIVFQLGFGLAPTFATSLACRFFMGAFNGIIGGERAAFSHARAH